MRIISKNIADTIERMDTMTLEQHIAREYKIKETHCQFKLIGYGKQVKASLQALQNVETTHSASNPKDDQKILRWWEVTAPDYQSL
jgi:hypothetical protein